MSRTGRAALGSSAFIGVLGLAGLVVPAQAQQPGTVKDEIETIIVTATKRAEALKDIPQSVTAIDGATIERTGAVEFSDYATSVPNLSFGYAGEGRSTSRQFQLRGIFGAETSALYIDDTAVPVTMDPRVIDIERVEVLRGPQGSLFGSRSMGGLVRLVTKQPDLDAPEARAHLGVGLIHKGGTDYQVSGSFNQPLSSTVALRITGYFIRDGGFIDRLVDPDASAVVGGLSRRNGDERLNEDVNLDDTYGAQAALRVDLSENFSITPRIIYQKTDSDGPAFVDNRVDNLLKIRQFDVDETTSDEYFLGSLTASYFMSMGEFISSTSYFSREASDVEDSTIFVSSFLGGPALRGVSAPSITSEIQEDHRFTQEFRFVSSFDGPLNFIAGLFYQEIETEGGFPPQSIIPAGAPFIGFRGFAAGDSFFSLASTNDMNRPGFAGGPNS